MTRGILITPERTAVSAILRATRDLKGFPSDEYAIVQAANGLHLALTNALVCALSAGPDTTPLTDRALAELQSESQEPIRIIKGGLRVESFRELLRRFYASRTTAERSHLPELDDELLELLERLTFVRDSFQHPKPSLNFVYVSWILDAFRSALEICRQAMLSAFLRSDPQIFDGLNAEVEALILETRS